MLLRSFCLSWVVGTALVAQAFDQFSPASSPPTGMIFDDVRGEIVNFETQMATPILVTRAGLYVVAANEADNRLVAYSTSSHQLVEEVPLGQGICAIAERPPMAGQPNPREIWVTLRHQAAVMVVSTASSPWKVVNLLRPQVASADVGAREADSPGGIVFNANGTKAFVAQANTDSLTVYDTVNKVWAASIPLTRVHNGQTVAMNEPFSVTRVGSTIVVASLASGNQTLPEENPGSALPGPKVEVKDLDQDPNRSLPDLDLVLVDSATNAVIGDRRGLTSMSFGIRAGSASGTVMLTGYHSRNGEFIGERSFQDGKVVFNRMSIVDVAGSNPPVLVNLEDLTPGSFPPKSIVMPTDMVQDGAGRVFVAGYASANIGVFNATTGAFQGLMTSQAGPRGLAYFAGGNRIYSFNRIANSITWYDLAAGIPATPSGSVALSDPTFDRVKQGRDRFNRANSAKLTTFCGSCHPDVRKDLLAWDLSKFADPGTGFTLANPPTLWTDRKGVMTTQDLRGLGEVPPYHWRGEQKDLDEFNDAFKNLLHGRRMQEADFGLLQDYVFSCVYPPNPFQPMNRGFTTEAAQGVNVYTTNTLEKCVQCHAFPTGTDCSGTDPLVGLQNSTRFVKTTQLRGLWTKDASQANVNDSGPVSIQNSVGAGLFHSGVHPDLSTFLPFFFSGLGADLVPLFHMMQSYDSGLAPATQWSEWVTAPNALNNRAGFLVDQAQNAHCDLAVKARWQINGTTESLGMVYRPATGTFDLDDSAVEAAVVASFGPIDLPLLLSEAAFGRAELLFLGTPVWSGERIGVDRDRDGLFDRDELAVGAVPTDPDSDDDGLWDGEDFSPLGGPNALPMTPPAVVPGSIRVVYATTNSIKITWETDRLSPSRLEWGLTGFTQATGDPFPLPTGGATTSNLWKRKHSGFVRVTEDERAHFVRIVTQGQTGLQGGATVLPSPSTTADQRGPSTRVSSIDLSHVTSGSVTTYSATVVVVDNHYAPQIGATVNGLFTVFINGVGTQTAIASGPTLANGSTTLVIQVTGQSAGDSVQFDVPMGVSIGGGPIEPGVVNPALPRFDWSQNEVSSAIDFWTP